MRKAIGIKLNNPSFSYSQSSALLAIDSQKEISQREIASRLHLQPATVVSLIDKLEKLKLVQRKPTSLDRRKYHIALTPQGKALAGKIRQEASQLENFLREKLGKREAEKFFLTVEAISTYVNDWQEKVNTVKNPRKEVKNESFSSKRSLAV
ncbi:MarR family transcriptional regulator [Candidatus Curtissbacteria bacterium]|nr:MarR family transcriptional regulator [Candidatus Curtissbacteria bacterium]